MKKTIKIRIDNPFAYLCDLLDLSPERVLQDFVDSVSLSARHDHGEEARSLAVEYFMSMGYEGAGLDLQELGFIFSDLELIRQYLAGQGGGSGLRQYREWYQTWLRIKNLSPAGDDHERAGEL